jgi:hypothetical protein
VMGRDPPWAGNRPIRVFLLTIVLEILPLDLRNRLLAMRLSGIAALTRKVLWRITVWEMESLGGGHRAKARI